MDSQDRPPTLAEFEAYCIAEAKRAKKRARYWSKKRNRAGGIDWHHVQRSHAEDNMARDLEAIPEWIVEFHIHRHTHGAKP